MSRTHDVMISAFDLDRLESELSAAMEQRDMLAEAMESMWPFIEEDDQPNCNTPAFSIAIAKYEAALAAWKGGQP
jgi:hypothetical protein